MTRWSLRTRMLAMAAIATLAALAIAGWAIAGILERFVIQGVDQRLDAQLAVMASAITDDGSINRARLEQRLGVLDAGPEWRWRITAPGGEVGSSDFPTLDLMPPRPGDRFDSHASHAITPHEGKDRQGRVHARQTIIQTSKGPVALFAAAPAGVIAQPISAALIPLLTIIVVLAAIFAIAALLQQTFGLRPVLALRDQVAEIRSGARSTVGEDQPSELRPLAVELNALADETAAALTLARASASNLAHALKTPVATLALTIGDNSVAAAQVERIDGIIRHHLARARTAATGRRATTLVSPVIADVVAATGALHPHATITVDILSDLAVAVDMHDLTEIMGNLIDNAARYARNTVSITAARENNQAVITIEDDGAGIPSDRLEAATLAGVRLDEGAAGYGFGLAIVHNLVTFHDGTLQLQAGQSDGLRAIVILPVPGSRATPRGMSPGLIQDPA